MTESDGAEADKELLQLVWLLGLEPSSANVQDGNCCAASVESYIPQYVLQSPIWRFSQEG